MSELLSDVLDIPRAAGAEDYVLRLTDGVEESRIAATIDQYVVTPPLVTAFDSALGLVAEAMTTGVSRGAFLSGSFGSGKSHFMAVLYALLRHNSVARDKVELQPVIDKHDQALRDKDVLPVAFHLLGAESMEEALFKGYVRQISARHPGAPLPALYLADGLLADADLMRKNVGDEVFFAGLNGGRTAPADRWSRLLGSNVTWTAASYESAKAAAPGSELRQKLITALVDRYFRSYTQQAKFVDLDTGLAEIARNAKSLGHDAVVLFLDELVLWLAFSVQDREFFRRESQKITKLVESGTGPRAIPLISFVSRQMDLRRWFADSGANGAEQEALDRAFRHQEGRFSTIELGDDNLPYVAHRRLLRRRTDNPLAEQVLGDAFARINRRPDIWDVLLDGVNTDDRHRGADEETFRLTYPFSPALVSTLRDLASVMQRERTALKVMQQMLVDRRATLTVDDVIPVGDSFDYIVQGPQGSQPLDAQSAALFKSAATLYRDKLRPLILADNELTEADLADPEKVTPAFRAHDRLAKTLLLSAVAPRVPALKELTASRLASLNHGSIKSPLQGREAGVVLAKVKDWQRRVPEIHVSADPKNPVIRVQLSDVDYESVVENAKGEDNEGRRRELIKDLVREALGVAEANPDVFGVYQHPVVWRGSRRTVDLLFGNVRESSWLNDDHFRARPGSWRFVIDFPFDDPGFSTAQDLERLDEIKDRGPRGRVIAWLPRFLSADRMRDVRRLVILDWLLTGAAERWRTHSDHLSEVDRVQARAILESQRTALRELLRRSIQEAYGAARETPGTLAEDGAENPVLVSLDAGFSPASPVGADLGAAFRNLVDQAFGTTYRAHPQFEPSDTEVTVRDLAAVYAHIDRAVADQDGRVPLQGDTAAVRRVANPLGAGYAAETAFLFSDDRFSPWSGELERAAARDGVRPEDTVTVGTLRGWIDALEPKKGLRDEVADLIILAWAALRTRAWYERGGPIAAPRPGSLRPEMELRPEPLPTLTDWRKVASRAEALFGLHANSYLTAAGVAELTADIQSQVGALLDCAVALVLQVENAYHRLGLTESPTGRLATARAGAALLTSLRGSGDDRVRIIETLARAELPATETVLANSLTRAAEVTTALASFPWDRLRPLQQAEQDGSESGQSAASTLRALREAVTKDEFTSRIKAALIVTDDALYEWLAAARLDPGLSGGGTGDASGRGSSGGDGSTRTDRTPLPDSGSYRTVSDEGAGNSGRAVKEAGNDDDNVLTPLGEFLRAHHDQRVVVEWRVQD
jgi:hypothetical protein